MEKMTLVEALDKRDMMQDRIYDRIQQAEFVEWHKHNESGTSKNKQNIREFEMKARKEYEEIKEQIAYYQRLNHAISRANAEKMVQTSAGEMSIAAAIALRNRIRKEGYMSAKGTNFEYNLVGKMELGMKQMLNKVDEKNEKLLVSADTMRNSILSKENKGKDDLSQLAVVDNYVTENTAELIDPIDVNKTSVEIREKMEALAAELNMKLKIANATVEIEVEPAS